MREWISVEVVALSLYIVSVSVCHSAISSSDRCYCQVIKIPQLCKKHIQAAEYMNE